MRLVDHLNYRFLRALAAFFSLLPRTLATAFGSLLGQLAMLALPKRARLCRANLRRAGFDERLCPRVFRHLGRMAIALLRSYHTDIDRLVRQVEVHGFEHYRQARRQSERVLLVTAHLGNWEVLPPVHVHLAGRGMRIVVRAVEQPGVNRFVEEIRSRNGIGIVDKSRGLRAMIKVLRAGEDLGVLIDQKVRPGLGVSVPFFGEMLPSVPVASVLARATGALIQPVFTGVLPDGRSRIDYLPAFPPSGDDAADTARLNSLLEEYIRRYPEQWFWVHDRWKYAEPMVDVQSRPASQ
ncbi:KDO2-lipid IV(A) lauroyltransferase [Geothermobacter ehrlichii]|uniref:KDO2-lipid IV(A) lauroyltransferase n=1 Tax=Geothermobacter ehrlichii TaxID=213224 RepID=A0A5D3WKI9_9BACT|nr:lysophospholipid acyltransferase family protein [Geothermobacter ehrlichii]TYO98446.1 KDO2-lipid IV(A) lauroyltransferase [Geothermobacter ehrlichii]